MQTSSTGNALAPSLVGLLALLSAACAPELVACEPEPNVIGQWGLNTSLLKEEAREMYREEWTVESGIPVDELDDFDSAMLEALPVFDDMWMIVTVNEDYTATIDSYRLGAPARRDVEWSLDTCGEGILFKVDGCVEVRAVVDGNSMQWSRFPYPGAVTLRPYTLDRL